MNKTKIFSLLLSVLLPLFLVGAVVYATTTVGDDISVGGDLDIVGNELQATTGILNISKSGSMTTILGTFNVDEAVTFDTTLAVGTDLTVTGNDIIFGNAETISNATDGVIAITAPTTTFSGVIAIGSHGSGVALTTASPYGLDVHTKPTSVLTAGDTGMSVGIHSRYEVGAVQTNQISIVAIEGQLRPKFAMADGAHAGVRGYVEADAVAFTGTDTTTISGGHFSLELPSGATLANDLWLCGVLVDANVNSGINVSAAKFVGIRLKKTAGTLNWETGIDIEDTDIGIDIGTATTGIALTGTQSYGIDMNSGTMSTADIRLGNGALIVNTDADTLTITEATTTISGNLSVTGNFTPAITSVTGGFTVGTDLIVTGNDIIFGNAETISNATDGVIAITAPTTTFSGVISMGSHGSGVALTTASPYGLDVHTKPTSVLTAGDTGMSVGIHSRYEVGAVQTNQISIVAIEGQLRPKFAMADGAHAGVRGYVEADAVAFTGTDTTTISGGHFSLELPSGATLANDLWLCGVLVDANVNSGINVSAAKFVGIRLKKTAGTLNWETGIDIEDTDIGIDIGSCTTGIALTGTTPTGIDMSAATINTADIVLSNSETIKNTTDGTIALTAATTTFSGVIGIGDQGTGIALTTSSPFGLNLHVKPVVNIGAGNTGRTCGIRMRYEVGADQTSQLSHSAVMGHLRVKKDLADGVHAGIEGYVEISEVDTVIGGTATTQTTAGSFAVESDANFVISAGWLTGVVIDSSVHGDVSMANCEFAGLRIKTSTGKESWEYGIHIEGATTGITITTSTTGISFTGTHTNGIDLTSATLTQALDNALFSIGSYSNAKAVTMTDNYLPLQVVLTNDGNVNKTMSAAYFKVGTAGDTALMQYVTQMIRMNIDNPIESAYGIQAHLTFGDTGDASTETIGVSAQLAGTAAAGTGYHWGVKSDLRAVNTPSGAGNTSAAFFGVATVDACNLFYGEVLSGKTVDKGLYLHGAGTITNGVSFAGTVTNVLDFANNDGTNGAGSSNTYAVTDGANADAIIQIDIAGTPYYIPAYDADAITNEW